MCWGSGDQLGLGRPGVVGQYPGQVERLSAIDFGSGHSVRKLLAGYYVTCAWLDNEEIKCYGSSRASLASFGSTSDLSLGGLPWTTSDLCPAVGEGSGYKILELDLGIYFTVTSGFITTSTGSQQACAILADGSVRCWGYNHAGSLGAEDSHNRLGVEDFLQHAVDLGEGQFATQLVAGAGSFCVVLNNATLKCWGRNDVGQLGLGHSTDVGDDGGEMGDSLPTVDLGAGRTVRQVSLGYLFGCALLDDDSLKCWGENSVGQLGRGDTSAVGDSAGQMGDHLPAIDLGTGRTVHQVAVGHSFVCAVLDDASLKCWGSNSYGQLGFGHTNNMGDSGSEMGDHLPTVDLGTGRTVLHVTTGYYHACAVLDNSTVKCWGLNDEGQLGLGHTTNVGGNALDMGENLPAVALSMVGSTSETSSTWTATASSSSSSSKPSSTSSTSSSSSSTRTTSASTSSTRTTSSSSRTTSTSSTSSTLTSWPSSSSTTVASSSSTTTSTTASSSTTTSRISRPTSSSSSSTSSTLISWTSSSSTTVVSSSLTTTSTSAFSSSTTSRISRATSSFTIASWTSSSSMGIASSSSSTVSASKPSSETSSLTPSPSTGIISSSSSTTSTRTSSSEASAWFTSSTSSTRSTSSGSGASSSAPFFSTSTAHTGASGGGSTSSTSSVFGVTAIPISTSVSETASSTSTSVLWPSTTSRTGSSTTSSESAAFDFDSTVCRSTHDSDTDTALMAACLADLTMKVQMLQERASSVQTQEDRATFTLIAAVAALTTSLILLALTCLAMAMWWRFYRESSHAGLVSSSADIEEPVQLPITDPRLWEEVDHGVPCDRP
ncbi:HERC2 [Symbiodinium sp. CCMP2592]|nr:HERC2 [Symbiodinium sp. CCMP2592]